jgi:hypothetical protein
MFFALVFEMEIINLVLAISRSYESYIISNSVNDGKNLYDQVINIFRHVSAMGDQSVQMLNNLFVQYPVLEQACSILAQNTPTAQDTRNTKFLISRPTPF